MTDKEEDRGKIIESLVTRLESRLIEVERLRALTNWQPIETAPRDGTWILLTGGSVDWDWDGDSKPRVVAAQFRERNADSWQFAWFDAGYYGEYENPTHWMPLPEPPGA